ncbi:MAG TPA: hypothetical protein VJB57_19760, partial [Dehalococcoidia bacterium]|nr:hypothetical protein [Dehalococcoidia bacterium]
INPLHEVCEVASPATTCTECGGAAHAGSSLCGPHLRGLALAAIDRRHWPRLRLHGGRVVKGDDGWRPWLRGAKTDQLLEVLEALGVSCARR